MDAIPPINVEFGVNQICPDCVSTCVGYTYNIMSLTASLWFLELSLLYNSHLQRTC